MCYQYPTSIAEDDSIFVALPSTDDKVIDVYSFPSELLKVRVPRIQTVETGMVMAVKLVRSQATQRIYFLQDMKAVLRQLSCWQKNIPIQA